MFTEMFYVNLLLQLTAHDQCPYISPLTGHLWPWGNLSLGQFWESHFNWKLWTDNILQFVPPPPLPPPLLSAYKWCEGYLDDLHLCWGVSLALNHQVLSLALCRQLLGLHHSCSISAHCHLQWCHTCMLAHLDSSPFLCMLLSSHQYI